MKTNNYYSGSGQGCSIASWFMVLVILVTLLLLLFSCAPTNRLTEQQRVEKMDEFCQYWQQYKDSCYADSVEWCEYSLDLETGEEDTVCWFEHPYPTLDGFYNFLDSKWYGDDEK